MLGLVRIRRSRGAAVALTAAAATLALAGPAAADTATIAVTDTAGRSDPAVDVARTFTVRGNSATAKEVFVKFRNPGGAPCAPTAESDSGSYFRPENDFYAYEYGREANGDFSFSDVHRWRSPGTFVFCIWIADSRTSSASAITQTITFRRPGGTISGSVTPFRPNPGEQFTITIGGASEAPKSVYAKIRGSGTPCAQTFDGDSGAELVDGTDVDGNYSIPVTWTTDQAGSYLVCMWLASSSDDPTPVAGPQPLTFDVGEPVAPAPAADEKSAACLAAEARGRRLRRDMRRHRSRLRRARTQRARRLHARRYRVAKRKLNRTRQTVRRECP